jgi:hypothetical protein
MILLCKIAAHVFLSPECDSLVTTPLLARYTAVLQPTRNLLGHAKIESAVRYLATEVDGALEMAGDAKV